MSTRRDSSSALSSALSTGVFGMQLVNIQSAIDCEKVLSSTQSSYFYSNSNEIIIKVTIPAPHDKSDVTWVVSQTSYLLPSLNCVGRVCKVKANFEAIMDGITNNLPQLSVVVSGKTANVDHALNVITWIYDTAVDTFGKDPRLLERLVSQKCASVFATYYSPFAWTSNRLYVLPKFTDKGVVAPELTPRSIKLSGGSSLTEPNHTPNSHQRTIQTWESLQRNLEQLDSEKDKKRKLSHDEDLERPHKQTVN